MGNLQLCPPSISKEEKNNTSNVVAVPETKESSSNHNPISVRQNLIFTATFRGDVKKYYDIVRVLGEGSMGSVSLARKKQDFVGGSAYTSKRKGLFGRMIENRKKAPLEVIDDSKAKLYAVKSIILSRVSDDFLDELRNEIAVLQSLDHPNIVKAYEVYETSINIYLVLEHCSGGDLYSRIPYSEKESAKIVGKLLSAITHMHKHNITHRDIKFENIMFESRAPDAEIKLIDFGLSKKMVRGGTKFMTEGVGTIYTMAPQVLKGIYTSQADIWSIGVITYMLLSNTKPFYGKKRRQVINKILSGEFKFYASSWENISEEAKQFVTETIEVDPKVRLNAEKALHHKWLSKTFPLVEITPESNVMDSVHDNIVNYGAVSEFKKIALMVLAHKSTREEIIELRKAFDAFDSANDGTISLEEFKAGMMKSRNQYSEQDVEDIFRSIDVGADGEIYYLEFLAATLQAHGRITEERLADAFDRLDSDDSGMISKQNLRDLLGEEYSEEKINNMLKEVECEGEEGINFDAFRKIFRAEQLKEEKKIGPQSTHSSFGITNNSQHSSNSEDEG